MPVFRNNRPQGGLWSNTGILQTRHNCPALKMQTLCQCDAPTAWQQYQGEAALAWLWCQCAGGKAEEWVNSSRLPGRGVRGSEGEVSQHGWIWQQALPAWHLRGSAHAANSPHRGIVRLLSSGGERGWMSQGEWEREMKRYSMREKKRDRAGEDRKRIEANSGALEFTTTGTGIREKQRTNRRRILTFSWTRSAVYSDW